MYRLLQTDYSNFLKFYSLKTPREVCLTAHWPIKLCLFLLTQETAWGMDYYTLNNQIVYIYTHLRNCMRYGLLHTDQSNCVDIYTHLRNRVRYGLLQTDQSNCVYIYTHLRNRMRYGLLNTDQSNCVYICALFILTSETAWGMDYYTLTNQIVSIYTNLRNRMRYALLQTDQSNCVYLY